MKDQHSVNFQWKQIQNLDVDKLMEKYRPKVLRKYEENGYIVTVYESRYV